MIGYLVGIAAEWTVAVRENWQLRQLSRRAWIAAALLVFAAVWLLVWIIP